MTSYAQRNLDAFIWAFRMGRFRWARGDGRFGIIAPGEKLSSKGWQLCAIPSTCVSIRGGIVIGDGFSTNTGLILSISSGLTVGNEVLFAWDVTVIDGDGHSILDLQNLEQTNRSRQIVIGDHVWLSSKATLLKGAKVGSDSVVASNSLVAKQFEQPHCLIGGTPARILKNNITWKR